MTARVIAGTGCPGDNCPTTYDGNNQTTSIVRGDRVSAARAEELGIGPLPDHEVLVEVPNGLLNDHVANSATA